MCAGTSQSSTAPGLETAACDCYRIIASEFERLVGGKDQRWRRPRLMMAALLTRQRRRTAAGDNAKRIERRLNILATESAAVHLLRVKWRSHDALSQHNVP
jgi:hypothetical protein